MANQDDYVTQLLQAADRNDRLAGDTEDDVILDGTDDVRGIAEDEDDDFDDDDDEDLDDADEEEEEAL